MVTLFSYHWDISQLLQNYNLLAQLVKNSEKFTYVIKVWPLLRLKILLFTVYQSSWQKLLQQHRVMKNSRLDLKMANRSYFISQMCQRWQREPCDTHSRLNGDRRGISKWCRWNSMHFCIKMSLLKGFLTWAIYISYLIIKGHFWPIFWGYFWPKCLPIS